MVSGLGRCEIRENGWPLEGVIADHVLSYAGQTPLAVVGDQFGRGLAVVSLLDRFEQSGFIVSVDRDPLAATGG